MTDTKPNIKKMIVATQGNDLERANKILKATIDIKMQERLKAERQKVLEAEADR